jgi:hypothetical protein
MSAARGCRLNQQLRLEFKVRYVGNIIYLLTILVSFFFHSGE